MNTFQLNEITQEAATERQFSQLHKYCIFPGQVSYLSHNVCSSLTVLEYTLMSFSQLNNSELKPQFRSKKSLNIR